MTAAKEPTERAEIMAQALETELIPNTDASNHLLIKRNQELRHSSVPPLRFHDVNSRGEPRYLDPKLEALRNKIWHYYFEERLSNRKIAEVMGVREGLIGNELTVCRARYDEWINAYGLSVYGSPAQRLEDLMTEFRGMMEEVDADLKDEDDSRENSNKDVKELRKLRLEIMDRIAKYQAIEPPKRIDLTVRTPAEETREKMIELFPESKSRGREVVDEDEVGLVDVKRTQTIEREKLGTELQDAEVVSYVRDEEKGEP